MRNKNINHNYLKVAMRSIFYIINVAVFIIFFYSISQLYAYEAFCKTTKYFSDHYTPENLPHNFKIIVKNKILMKIFNSSSENMHFKSKVGDNFCYEAGNMWSEDMFEWVRICVGKFDNGEFLF